MPRDTKPHPHFDYEVRYYGRRNANPFNTYDKDITVIGPGGLRFDIDFDDVDHSNVEHNADKMMRILNKHWDDPEFN